MFLQIFQDSQENTCSRVFFFKKSKDNETWHRCFPKNFAKFVITPFYRTYLGDCICRKAAQGVLSKITSLNIKDNYPKRIVWIPFKPTTGVVEVKRLCHHHILGNFRNCKNSCSMAHPPEAPNLSFLSYFQLAAKFML